MDVYHTETVEHAGKKYRIDYVYDQGMRPPWEEHDGHGPVSEWTTRDKRPGEWIEKNMNIPYNKAATLLFREDLGCSYSMVDVSTKKEL